MRLPPPVLLASLLASLLAVLTAWLGLGGIPHVSDEIVYTLQSRLLAAGLRVGPAAEDASRVLYPFWVASPTSHGVFPVGWPALLAVGEAAGVPWLVNPLLAAALPPLAWLIARRLAPPAATLAPWLAALCPAVWILSASRMAQTSTAVALLAAATVVLYRPKRAALWWGMGAAVGYAVLARPFDAAVLGGPLLVAGLLRGGPVLPLVLLPGIAAGLTLLDNHLLTGHALTFPVNPWYDAWVADDPRIAAGCNRLGFGPDIGCVPTFGEVGHTPAKAARIALDSLRRLDRLLLGAPGGLVAVALGLWALPRRQGLLLLAPLLVCVLAYAPYWSLGMAYGPRLWHPAVVPLLVLAAAGLHRLLGRWAPLVLLLPVASVGWIYPQLSDYWCVDTALSERLSAAGIEAGVLFVQTRGAAHRSWPALGVDDFVCAELLESGDALHMLDPTTTRGGLQVRHAPAALEDTVPYLQRYHPGAAGWVAWQDVSTGAGWRLFAIRPGGLEEL